MSIKVEKTDNKNELKLEFTVAAEKFEEAMKKVYFQTAEGGGSRQRHKAVCRGRIPAVYDGKALC